MALHILNCCVDNIDAQSNDVAENLAINDMESMVEIVLEQVLQIDNAIPEHDDPDQNGNAFSVKKGIDSFVSYSALKIMLTNGYTLFTKHHFYTENYSEQFHPELTPPPPKA